MSFLMISQIVNNGNLIGYRLIDTETREISNVPTNNLIEVLKSGRATVDNISISRNKVTGTNGSVDRYPKSTVQNQLIELKLSPLIIINRTAKGFTVCDYKGQVKEIDEQLAIDYAKQAGIANGKLVYQDDGRAFISAINGNYPVKEGEVIPENPKTDPKPVEEKQNTQGDKPDITSKFTQQQLEAINYYYKNCVIKDKCSESIAKAEITKLAEIVSSRKETLNYDDSLIGTIIRALSTLGDSDTWKYILGEEFYTGVKLFVMTKLPIPVTMRVGFAAGLKKNPYSPTTNNHLFDSYGNFNKKWFDYDIAQRYSRWITDLETGEDTKSFDRLLEDLEVKRLYNNISTKLQDLVEKYNIKQADIEEVYSGDGKVSASADDVEKFKMTKLSDFDYSTTSNREYLISKAIDFGADGIEGFYTRFIKLTKENREKYGYESDELYRKKLERFKARQEESKKTAAQILEDTIQQQLERDRKQEELRAEYARIQARLDKKHNEDEKQEETKTPSFGEIVKNYEQTKQAEAEAEAAEAAKAESSEDDNPPWDESNQSSPSNVTNVNNATITTSPQSASDATQINNSQNVIQSNNSSNQNSPEKQLCDYDSKPDKVDKVAWFVALHTANTVDENDINIKIATDIANRKLKYKELSYKQKYRMDSAIAIVEKANLKRLGITGKPKSTNQNSTDTVVNETYALTENDDITKKVKEMISRANSVEMAAVLDKFPKVLDICYSVIKYNKVSTRQLNHINPAYELLKSI